MHHTIEPAGQIKHLAAAVLVDDFVEMNDVGGKPQETRRKRTPEEMKQLDDLVRAAIGFNAQRGDELSIQNVSFQAPPVETPDSPRPSSGPCGSSSRGWALCAMPALGILFLLIYLLVLRPGQEPGAGDIAGIAGNANEQAALARQQGAKQRRDADDRSPRWKAICSTNCRKPIRK